MGWTSVGELGSSSAYARRSVAVRDGRRHSDRSPRGTRLGERRCARRLRAGPAAGAPRLPRTSTATSRSLARSRPRRRCERRRRCPSRARPHWSVSDPGRCRRPRRTARGACPRGVGTTVSARASTRARTAARPAPGTAGPMTAVRGSGLRRPSRAACRAPERCLGVVCQPATRTARRASRGSAASASIRGSSGVVRQHGDREEDQRRREHRHDPGCNPPRRRPRLRTDCPRVTPTSNATARTTPAGRHRESTRTGSLASTPGIPARGSAGRRDSSCRGKPRTRRPRTTPRRSTRYGRSCHPRASAPSLRSRATSGTDRQGDEPGETAEVPRQLARRQHEEDEGEREHPRRAGRAPDDPALGAA